jgi:hypothetical protein
VRRVITIEIINNRAACFVSRVITNEIMNTRASCLRRDVILIKDVVFVCSSIMRGSDWCVAMATLLLVANRSMALCIVSIIISTATNNHDSVESPVV